MKFIKFFLSFSFVFLIIFSACPFAYAAESYNIPFSQPQVTVNSGYIEVLFEQSDGDRYIRVFTWQTTTGSDWTELDLPVPLFLTVNSNGFIEFKFEANPESIFYSVVSIYDPYSNTDVHFNVWQNLSSDGVVTRSLDYDDDIVSFNIYGSYAQFTSDLTNSYIPAFTVSYGDDTSLSDILQSLSVINNSLVQLHSDNVSELEAILDVIDQMAILHSDNLTNLEKLEEIYSFISNELYLMLETIELDIDKIYKKLNSMLVYMRTHYDVVEADLSRLIELLEMQGDSVQTTVDSSNVDNAIDIENSLLDNSNVDVSDVVNVEVNQNALTVIWDLVEKFLNSHGKVFGMVLTVLSLGLVAMILGRKV